MVLVLVELAGSGEAGDQVVRGSGWSTRSRNARAASRCLGVERGRKHDPDLHVEVAGAVALELGHALPGEADRLAALCPGRDGEQHAALERGDRDLAAQQRLAQRDRKLPLQVGATPGEHGVRAHPDRHDDIAPVGALARKADPASRCPCPGGSAPRSACPRSRPPCWCRGTPPRGRARWAPPSPRRPWGGGLRSACGSGRLRRRPRPDPSPAGRRRSWDRRRSGGVPRDPRRHSGIRRHLRPHRPRLPRRTSGRSRRSRCHRRRRSGTRSGRCHPGLPRRSGRSSCPRTVRPARTGRRRSARRRHAGIAPSSRRGRRTACACRGRRGPRSPR